MRLFTPLALLSCLTGCTSQYYPDICAAGGPETSHLTREAKACVQKQARVSASLQDEARDVADVVLAECSGVLLNDLAAASDTKAATTVSDGSNTQWAEARELALFQVVEERAEHCSLQN